MKHHGCILAYQQLFGGSYAGSLGLRFVRFPLPQAQLRGFKVRIWLLKEVVGQQVLIQTTYSTVLQAKTNCWLGIRYLAVWAYTENPWVSYF